MALVTCSDCQAQVSDQAPACPRCGRPQTPGRPVEVAHVQRDAPAAEQTLFQDVHVTVTNIRAILSGVTYAMANVTSVREFVEPKPAARALLGFMFVAWGLVCVNIHIADSADVGYFLLAIGGGLLLWYFVTKPRYWVRIGTAGAETNAIWSHDPAWTRTVVTAMNNAIVGRG